MTTTAKLEIPLIDGAKPLLTRQFNDALQAIDQNALPKKHAESRAHFELWQTGKTYKKKDVVRTPTCPSWGFWICEKAGTSAGVEPIGYGEGDTFADGTVSWVLKRFGTGEGGSSTEHAVVFRGSDINVVYPYQGVIQSIAVLMAEPVAAEIVLPLVKMDAASFAAGIGTWEPLGGRITMPSMTRYKLFTGLVQNIAVKEGDVLRIGLLENDDGLSVTIKLK
ncbi:hypothetical protein [Selenomonas sputigena]|uniref:hypothetical protein n=1 Tax=Selenomonas sputigena TaxID=69823 RepID=UPI002061C9BB|nr:hypothetical protein [Selenomonas sputigena]DAX51533.1 MAG TPA: hypothetical protein [Caudoviricetes sp.]